MTNIVLGGSTPSDGFELKSVRFNEGSSGGKLTFTPSGAATDGRILTYSFWFKGKQDAAGLNSNKDFEFLTSNVTDWDGIGMGRLNGKLNWYFQGASYGKLETTAVYRDPAAWYHVVCRFNTTLATAGDRMRLYVNGEEVTSFSTDTNPTLNYVAANWNKKDHAQVIARSQDGSYPAGCYMAEAYMLDGSAVGPEYFGETNAATNQWQPKNSTDIKKAVTFGNNGWYLPFSNDALATSFIDGSIQGAKELSPTPTPNAGNRSGGQSYMYTQYPFVPTETISVDVLVVGGGAGGGGDDDYWGSGGGGGGGVSEITGKSCTGSTEYVVKVGAGGIGGGNNTSPSGQIRASANGGSSSFDTIISNGGGYAGPSEGGAGGCGGGGSRAIGPSGDSNQGDTGGATGYGFDAGEVSSAGGGGGGGGAGGAGSNASGDYGGDGGGGRSNSFQTGSAQTYAAGGGGGTGPSSGSGGNGGSGGGGNGGQGGTGAFNGGDASGFGSGGGGSGGGTNAGAYGGYGSDGIVIVRYQSSTAKATGGTITTYGAGGSQYYVHTFRHLQHTVTPNGNATNERISNHFTKPGSNLHIIGPKVGSSAIAFDGDGDYLSVPDSADWNFGSSDFTIEMWVNMPDVEFQQNNDLTTIWSQANTTSLYTALYWVTDNNAYNSKGFNFYAKTSGGGELFNFATGVSGINDGEWNHVAVVRNGSNWNIYINGVSRASRTGSEALVDWSYPVRFGSLWHSSGPYREWQGYLDEIRISDSARYTANFTPDTTAFTSDANTKLLIHSDTTMGSTTFTDSSSTGHTLTAGGNVMHVAPKFGTGMGGFIGTSGTALEISTTDDPDFNFNTSDPFTIEGWFSLTDASGGGNAIGSKHLNDGNNWSVGFDGSNVVWRTRVSSGSYSNICSGAHGMSNDTWYHVAFVRTTATDYKIYVDGIQKAAGTTSYSFTHADSSKLKIGINDNDFDSSQGTTYFKGYMDDYRVSRTARYTSGFTPSTTAFKDDKDTIALLHMDGGGGIDPTTNLATLPGEGNYFWDASTNAIFYGADEVPTNKSFIAFDGTGDFLEIPESSDFKFGDGDFTMECWINFSTLNSLDNGVITIFSSGTGAGSNYWALMYGDGTYSNYGIGMGDKGQGSWNIYQGDEDGWATDTWYHLALARDGSDIWFYRDGISILTYGSFGTLTEYAASLQIGDQNGIRHFGGSMDQIRFSNSCRYPSGTTFTPSTTPFTTDVNTKLLIQSDDFSEGGLGADHSGNYNYFTPTNLGAENMVLDNPNNNFCTMNPLVKATIPVTFSEGNLKTTPNNDWQFVVGTIPMVSGKWYWELLVGGASTKVGILVDNNNITAGGAGAHNGILYYPSNKIIDNTWTSYGAAFTTGDIIGYAVDMDGSTVTFYKNGVSQGAIAFSGSATTAQSLVPGGGLHTNTANWNFGQDSSFAGNKTAQGNQDGNDKGDFYYAPPSGYLALCTDNLSDPSIALPTDHFNTQLWTGTGSGQTFSNFTFQPDFLWFKQRNGTSSHALFDSVRGVNAGLDSGSTAVENTVASGSQDLVSFDDDGFTTGTVSQYGSLGSNNNTIVTWAWKAGGTAASNTDGTITSSVSANPTAGFSILSYTGNLSSGATVGHGLSQVPNLIIVKNRDQATNWLIGSEFLTSATWEKYLYFTTTGVGDDSTMWNDTAPSSSIFTLGNNTDINNTAKDYVAYCFHSVEGYSKVGTYVANGNPDGTFIYTGFSPAYILVRDVSGSGSWIICDNKRPGYNFVYKFQAEDSSAETSTLPMDLVSNGFKVRSTSGSVGTSGNNYIYLAFAESPFKTSNAR